MPLEERRGPLEEPERSVIRVEGLKCRCERFVKPAGAAVGSRCICRGEGDGVEVMLMSEKLRVE